MASASAGAIALDAAGRRCPAAPVGNALMLLDDDAGADEAAPLVECQALGRRGEREGARMRRCQQCIHQPGTVATALGRLGDDDHPGCGMVLAVGPPGRGRDDRPGTVEQHEALAELQRDGPVLEAVGPGHFLRQAQCTFQVMLGKRNQHHVVLVLAGAGGRGGHGSRTAMASISTR